MTQEMSVTDATHRFRLPLRHILDQGPNGRPMVFSYHYVYLQALKGAGANGLTVGQMRAHLALIDKIETAVAELKKPSGDASEPFELLLRFVQEFVDVESPQDRNGRDSAAAALAGAVAAYQRSRLIDWDNGFVDILPSEWVLLEPLVRGFPYNGVYAGAVQLDDDLNEIEVVEVQ